MFRPKSFINKLRRFELWASLVFFLFLLCMSIRGAFVGSEKAGAFFNAKPLVIFWLLFLFLLVMALFTFKRLPRKPGLLMIHLGCILVLGGAMWSSVKGHSLQKKLLNIDKIPCGYLIINEGTTNNRVVEAQANKELGRLPFSVHLEDFWMDYYWAEGVLHIHRGEEQTWHLPARVGEEQLLPEPLRRVKILRRLSNLKVTDRITDRPKDNINHALDIEIEWADGTVKSGYAFPPDMPHPMRVEGFEFIYHPGQIMGVKDYFSDLVILDYKNKIQKRQVIEVNKPMKYRGYHFYQSSYGHEARETNRGSQRVWYTVLGVVSDSGLQVVFAGYILLCVGVFWHCWFRHVPPYFEKRNTYGN